MSSYDGRSDVALAAICEVPRVVAVAHCASTMDVAAALADDGAVHGTVIVADTQGAGRGRSGNAWTSPPGTGVWASIVLRTVAEAPPGLLSLRVGLHLAAALETGGSTPLQLKWPNDLYLGGSKVGGVLIEASWQGSIRRHVIVGVGINVTSAPEHTPFAALGARYSRSEVLQHVVRAVLAAASRPGALADAEVDAFAARDVARNRAIVSPVPGIALGITRDGALRIRTPGGETQSTTGSLIFAPLDGAS